MDLELSKDIFRLIQKSQKVLVLTHLRPDGDAIGSVLSLAEVFSKVVKYIELNCLESIPEAYQQLPNSHLIRSKSRFKLDDYDLFIFADCGEQRLTGLASEQIKKISADKVVNIDHHPTNNQFGKWRLIDPDAAATCEILYEFYRSNQLPINMNVAQNLLTGIVDDTGGFQHSNTSAKTLKIAGELLGLGVSLSKISKILYNSKSIESLRLRGAILDRARLINKYNLSFSFATDRDYQNFQGSVNDLDGIANLLITDDKANISLMLSQWGDKIKGSFRTNRNDIDVSRLAQIFGGGGHRKAAGFSLPGRLSMEKGELVIV